MQLRYQRNLIKAQGKLAKITAIAWSPQVQGVVTRMAVATSDKIIHLFDENGALCDSFSTRPADKAQQNYSVKALAFSPCGTKLAVGQTDQIVYLYRIGAQWGEKKSILNKFFLNSSLMCMIWPQAKPTYIVVGLACGRVKACILTSTMKSSTLYSSTHSCISLAASPDGESFLSGHSDGSVLMMQNFKTDSEIQKEFARLDFAPVQLAWGRDVCAVALNKRIRFFTESGKDAQSFQLASDKSLKPFQVVAFNPTGDCLVVGNFDKFLTFNYTAGRKRGACWDKGQAVLVPNLLAVSALAWRPDGAALVVGSVAGAVDIFEVAARKVRHRSGLFEFSYVSSSQCVVRIIQTGQTFSVRSASEFSKVDIINEQFIVARTHDSFVIRDMLTNDLTEVTVGPVPPPPAKGATPLEVAAGRERIFLDHPGFVLVYTPGQVIVNKVGVAEPIGSVRTEFATSATTSVRVLEDGVSPFGLTGTLIATLQDPTTLQAVVVETGKTLGVTTHDCPLDFLELSPRGDKVLFRDYRKHLHVYDLQTRQKTTFLSQCSFAQWVPDADVIVAQAQSTISVWYSTLPENAGTPIQIEVPDGAEAEAVERELGSASVVLRGMDDSMIRVLLDEALIAYREFSAKHDFAQAVQLLSAAPKTPSIQASWRELAQMALKEGALAAAEASLAHAGDYAGSRFVYKTRKLKEKKDAAGLNGLTDPVVVARLAVLQKDFSRAEAVLVSAGLTEEAVALYTDLGRWSDVLRLTEKSNPQQAQRVRLRCIQDLEHQGHTDLAAEVYERDGQIVKAVEAYLRSGLAARAALLLSNHPDAFANNPSLSQEIAAKLEQAGLFDKAGELHELQGNFLPAIQAFRKGRAFDRALKLARQHSDTHVGQIRMEWAKWTREQGDIEGACARFVEAQAYPHAIETALAARMWNKAEKLLSEFAPKPTAESFAAEGAYAALFGQLAAHYKSTRDAPRAAKFFMRAGKVNEAIEVLLEVGEFKKAHEAARMCMSEGEVVDKFNQLAEKLEAEGNLTDAEQLWRETGNVNRAIQMYKNKGMFDQMIALVRQYFPDLLQATLQGLAQVRVQQRAYDEAERYFVEGGLWQDAVSMYRNLDMWKDAVRVTRQHGKRNDAKKLLLERAKAMAQSEDGSVSEQGLRMAFATLQEEGENDLCLDFMLMANAFDEAVQLAKEIKSNRLTELYLKRAEWHEDQGRWPLAEKDFVAGRRPEDAVEMYLHQRDYESALMVAERHCPDKRDEVFRARQQAGNGPASLNPSMQGQEQARLMQEQLRQQHRQQQQMLAEAQAQQQQQQQAASATAAPGVPSGRIEELVRAGDFKTAVETAAANQPNMLPTLLMQMIKAVVKKQLAPRDAAEAIAKHAATGMDAVDRAMEAMPALAREVLEGGALASQPEAGAKAALALKKSFLKLTAAPGGSRNPFTVSMKDAIRKNALGEVAAHALVAAHLVSSRIALEKAAEVAKTKGDSRSEGQLRAALAWQGASLMRFSDLVSAEWVFYQAGAAAMTALSAVSSKHDVSRLQALAYVAYNRFLDLSENAEPGMAPEALEDLIDNEDFKLCSDVPPPARLRVASNAYASELGQVKDMVLAWAVDSGIDKALPSRPCGSCSNQSVFHASLQCGSCRTSAEPCCVTGLPIVPGQPRAECPACHSGANQADWEALVTITRRCPWCESQV